MVELRLKFPPDFFDEEEKCGYVVTRKTKELWAVLLDLLAEFDRVCTKYGIQYYANGGTMLGAVRHRGFIPWDDDIDLMMLRDQYDKLCEIAQREFEYPYFFQIEKNDFGHLRGHAQLRNSDTTGMLYWEKGRNYTYNQGIFIDVFPLDSVVEDPKLFDEQKRNAIKYRDNARRWAYWTPSRFEPNNNLIKNMVKKIAGFLLQRCLVKKVDKEFELFENECKKYNYLETKKIAQLTFDFENEKLWKDRADFDSFIMMDFEFLKIPVIKGYDHDLKHQYGDYMIMEKTPNCHGNLFIDTSVSYKEYCKKQR